MKSFTKALVVVAVLAPIGGLAAYAAGPLSGNGPQEEPPRPHMGAPMGPMAGFRFEEKFDLNKDGKVTPDEIRKVLGEDFDKADANHDGVVTIDEYINFWVAEHREMIVRDFQRFDTKGDAKVTKDEFEKAADRLVWMMEHRPPMEPGPWMDGQHHHHDGKRGPMDNGPDGKGSDGKAPQGDQPPAPPAN